MTPVCTCPNPMREGVHEWTCGAVGEYEFVRCKDCDTPNWMCGVAESRCKECRKKWHESEEYKAAERQCIAEFLHNRQPVPKETN